MFWEGFSVGFMACAAANVVLFVLVKFFGRCKCGRWYVLTCTRCDQ